jgi:hypothetical protein
MGWNEDRLNYIITRQADNTITVDSIDLSKSSPICQVLICGRKLKMPLDIINSLVQQGKTPIYDTTTLISSKGLALDRTKCNGTDTLWCLSSTGRAAFYTEKEIYDKMREGYRVRGLTNSPYKELQECKDYFNDLYNALRKLISKDWESKFYTYEYPSGYVYCLHNKEYKVRIGIIRQKKSDHWKISVVLGYFSVRSDTILDNFTGFNNGNAVYTEFLPSNDINVIAKFINGINPDDVKAIARKAVKTEDLDLVDKYWEDYFGSLLGNV